MKRKLILWILIISILSLGVSATIPTTSVWHYYKFDNSTTLKTTTLDSKGSVVGTMEGSPVANVSCILGQCITYDSINDDIYFTTDGWGNWAANTSINLWFNADDWASNQVLFAYVGTATGGEMAVIQYAVGGNKLNIQTYNGSWVNTYVGYQNASVWTMFTYTCQNGASKIYINGVYKNGTTTSCPKGNSGRSTGSPPYTYSGYFPEAGSPSRWDGYIDELGIWNTTLSQSQITELYNSGTGKTYPFSASSSLFFTAKDEYTNAAINTFSVNLTWNNGTSQTKNTVAGHIQFSPLSGVSTYNVTYWNSTNYYSRTYTAQTITNATNNTLQGVLHQAEVCFNATSKVSDAWITPNNFTIGSTTRTSCFNITAGSHNVMAEKTGWFDKNQTFTIVALTNTTRTVENMSYANLTISAIDGITNASLTSCDSTIKSLNWTAWPGETLTAATNGSYYLINGTYNVTIDCPGYATTGAIANVSVAGHTNYTFTLFKSNSVFITIRDEITNDPIYDNVTVRWSNNATTWENVTDTSQLFVYNITAGVWTLLFYSSNYSTRTYTLTIGNLTSQNLTAYLISSTYSTIFTFKDIDTAVLLENVSVTMYKLLGITWTTVESKYSDISGRSQFYYDPIGSYKFYLSKPDYDDYVFYLNPILFSSYDVFMTKTDVLDYAVDFDKISVIYSPTSFNNEANVTFNFLISSPDGLLTAYGMNLTFPGGSSVDTGTNAIGEQLSVWVNITGATAYDRVKLVYNYTTTLSGSREFVIYLPINFNSSGTNTTTWMSNKDKTYGMGIFERILIATIIILFTVGIASLVGQALPGLALGMFVYGFLAYIGFIPLWAILPSMLIGVLFLTWKSGGY